MRFPNAGAWAKGVRLEKAPHHRTFQGLPIHIEHDVGDTRTGTAPDGTKWATKMKHAYGEILGTLGADGDPLDVFLGPDRHAAFAYVVQAKLPGSQAFDECKLMLGFPTRKAAVRAFRVNYDRPGFLLEVTRWPMPALLEVVREHPELQQGRLDARTLNRLRSMEKAPRFRALVEAAEGLLPGAGLLAFDTEALEKAAVRTHQRKLKDGRVVTVQAHHRRDVPSTEHLRRAIVRAVAKHGRPIASRELRSHLPKKHREVSDAELFAEHGHLVAFGVLQPHPDDVSEPRKAEPKPSAVAEAEKANQTPLALQLVLAWRDYPDPQVRKALERLMLFVGMTPVHAVGDVVPYDGIKHQGSEAAWPDDPVQVVEPGWAYKDPVHGFAPRVLERAKVVDVAPVRTPLTNATQIPDWGTSPMRRTEADWREARAIVHDLAREGVIPAGERLNFDEAFHALDEHEAALRAPDLPVRERHELELFRMGRQREILELLARRRAAAISPPSTLDAALQRQRRFGSRLATAYAELAQRPGRRVRIADLRKHESMQGMSAADFDRDLRALARGTGVELVGETDPSADPDALHLPLLSYRSVRIGGPSLRTLAQPVKKSRSALRAIVRRARARFGSP